MDVFRTGGHVVLVVLLSMALPVALSVVGPIYYGYMNGPYWRVLIWAAACTIGVCLVIQTVVHGEVQRC
jgi:hypothetical protein